MLFGLGLMLHGSFRQFLEAAKEAIQGSVGIMLQFPLYAGIMGIMKYAGLVQIFSNSIVSMADGGSLPLFTFLSAAIVNVFVPSGGGQWAVQGPIFVDACQQLDVPVAKVVMALAYGDQLTNMMQPFWALPLLGITGLKAKEILPYTLFLMMLGILIYTAVLLVF
jgi:short-chain fatty acids transporter